MNTQALTAVAVNLSQVIREKIALSDIELAQQELEMSTIKDGEEILFEIPDELGRVKVITNVSVKRFLREATSTAPSVEALTEYQLYISLSSLLDNLFWIIVRLQGPKITTEQIGARRSEGAFVIVRNNEHDDLWAKVKEQLHI